MNSAYLPSSYVVDESVFPENEDGIISVSLHPTLQLAHPDLRRLDTLSYDSSFGKNFSTEVQNGWNSNLMESLQRRISEIPMMGGVYTPPEAFGLSEKNSKLIGDRRDISRHEVLYRAQQQQEKRKLDLPPLVEGSLYETNYQVAPLLQGFGTHYATAWVGTPPQRKSVIVDTGSHFTAFPCVGCKNCGEEHHTDRYFDPKISTSFESVDCKQCQQATCNKEGRCVFSQSYTEGSSWQAYQVRDQYFIGGNDPQTAPLDPSDRAFSIPFMFGCQTSETGLFLTQLADGIMGMSAHEATLVKQMFNKKKLRHNMFTLCFRRELAVSKSGVLAGVMTLGGIDTRLNSSPMVFAKNVQPRAGWYTVYLKNVYIQQGTGSEDYYLPQSRPELVKKIPIRLESVNSGKGVIVDSGTTDTYLSETLKKPFLAAWADATGGEEYHNNAMKMSRSQMLKLPTVLIQMQAYGTKNAGSLDPDLTNGLTGALDPKYPNDILLAVPPTHYLEYSPSKDTYTSRLYFTESRGGVLGANSMQGHDVLFDWENGRVGFAVSTCDHKELEENEENIIKQNEGGIVGEEGSVVDCVLSKKIISKTCRESVDVASCQKESVGTLSGFETWVRVIEINPSANGMTCEAAASADMTSAEDTISCNDHGICEHTRVCMIECDSSVINAPKPKVVENPETTEPNYETGVQQPKHCGDSLWGSCTKSCSQAKVVSVLMDDGNCHIVDDDPNDGKFGEVRNCHIDSCGQDNPCLVPFVVHVIFGFHGANVLEWNKESEEHFAVALTDGIKARNEVVNIGPGDVHILMTSKWREQEEGTEANIVTNDAGDADQDATRGMKLIAEISIYNPTIDPSSQSASSCAEEDLYEFAKIALQVHSIMQEPQFFLDVINQSRSVASGAGLGESQSANNPFALVNPQKSKVLTSWTIKSEVNGNGFSSSFISQDGLWAKLQANATIPVIAIGLAIILCVLSMGVYFGYRMEAKSDLAEVRRGKLHSSNLMERMKARAANVMTEKAKGKYTPIPTRSRRMGEFDDNDLDGDMELA